MNNRIDPLCMLLSTDWFFERWTILGIRSDNSRCRKMQQKCRHIVDDLFAGEQDYWEASFETGRIKRTSDKFFVAASESALEPEDIDRFRSILADTQLEIRDASLLENLTRLLSASADPETLRGLSIAIANKVLEICKKVERKSDLRAEWNASESSWDLEMRKRTTELPEYLADFAIRISSKKIFIEQFWSQMMRELSHDEKDKLFAWYREMARELADTELTELGR